MPTTLQNLIDEACLLAGVDGIKGDAVAQLHLPQVFAAVGERMAANERTRHLLRRTKNLAVVNGSVTLTEDVLSDYIDDSVLLDPDDLDKNYSYISWEHFVREPFDPRLGHYSIEGEGELRVVEPGDAYTAVGGPTVVLRLSIPCSPEVPAAAASPIDARGEVVDELRAALVQVLKTSKRGSA